MPFPGYPLDTNRTNLTAAPDRHPLDHNQERAALNDLQSQVTSNQAAQVAGDTTAQSNLDARVPNVYSTYTPTLTGVALGTGGSSFGWYYRIGAMAHVWGYITLSTSGTVTPSGVVTVSLPVNIHATALGRHLFGQAFAIIGSLYPCRLYTNDATHIVFDTMQAPATPVLHGSALSNTNPGGAWGAGSLIEWSIMYPAA